MVSARVLGWVTTALLCLTPVWAQVELVRDGRATATIVLPDQLLPVETYAAEELTRHVRLAAGCDLPVRSEGEATGDGPRVYIGRCQALGAAASTALAKLAPNTLLIRTRGRDLCLAGRDDEGHPLHDDVSAGTLFAVYELLERQVGARWLWPGELGAFVPRRPTLVIPPTDLTLPPRLLHSRVRFGGLMISQPGWSSLQARDRFIHDQLVWLRRHRFARGISLEYGHGFEDYWDRFRDAHPEYFNLLPDGTRRSDPMYFGGEGRLVAMCVSEPGLRRERVREWRRTRTPRQPWVNCAENDTCGKCTCPRCLSWDVPGTVAGHPQLGPEEAVGLAAKSFAANEPDWYRWLGSLSDRYARFWLAAQKEARQTDPEATVLAYAYANYHEPPRRTKLNEGVVVAIVPALMFPWTADKRAAFREQWAGWAATGARLYLRPNYTLDGHAFPIFYAHKLAADFGFAAQRGLIATDFDSLTSEFGVQGPNHYVLARLHLHPDWPAERLLDEYYAAFGPASRQVRGYFAHWQRVSDAVTDAAIAAAAKARGPEGGSWSRFYLIADLIFTPPVMAEGRALLARAAQAAGPDATARERVAFLDKGLRHVELCLAVEQARREYAATGDLVGYQAALTTLDEYRGTVEADNVANMGFLRCLEAGDWDRALLTALRQPGERLPGPWRFRFDPEQVGEESGWQAPDLAAAWVEIGITTPWEKQPVGQEWEKQHGAGYNGVAWYRTIFRLQPATGPERVSLVFGAVDEACVIWVNGQEALRRPFDLAANPNSWQEAFEVNVTALARPDQDNSLVVRVEDNSGAGGIWKPVWLVQTPAATAAANLIPDGGFEEPETAWKTHVASGEFTFAADPSAAHGGKAAGRLTCVRLADREPGPGYGRAWGRWYQTGLPLRPGARYRLRLWVRAGADFTGTADIWFRSAEGGDGPGNRSLRVPPTKGLWQQVQMDDILAGSDAGALYLNLMNGTGTVWFDEVELTEMK